MPEIITAADAQYALELVRTICQEVGPGLPGTRQERERAAIIEGELARHLGADNVTVEEFPLAPGAFLGSLPISGLLLLAAALLNLAVGRTNISPWITAIASLSCTFFAILSFLLEYMLYYEFIDPVFRKGISENVIGVLRKPGTGDVRRLLILSGHHDSALENTWIHLLGYGFYVTLPTFIIGLLAMLVIGIIQLVGLIAADAGIIQAGTSGWILWAFPMLPAVIFTLFFNRGRKNGGTVPGAADNLSASALAVSMARFLVKNPAYIPDQTEIRFISFGSEEAGLRGSRRFVERHLAELKKLDARLLNYETVTYPEITILTSDVNDRVKNSPEMVQSVTAAAERAQVPYRVRPFTMGTGASDAGPFSQAGLKATTLLPFKMPEQIVAFYHQKSDTPEVLTPEPLLNVLKLTLEWLRNGGE